MSKTTTFRAPARVNLIGEHTDYNLGFVLPTTTNLNTRVTVTPTTDGQISAHADHFSESVSFAPGSPAVEEPLHWSHYVRGVSAALAARGVEVPGAQLSISGDIPLGGGLSSSASLEVATTLALLSVTRQTLTPEEVAACAFEAETRHVGLNCGIMDPMAVSTCPRDHALLLDCADQSTTTVSLPDDLSLLLVDSGVRHQLPDGEYNHRTDECHAAANQAGVASLRDLAPADLSRLEGIALQRARHVLAENQRTLDAVVALRERDLNAFGALVNASHESLRDDFEVSCDAVDDLQALCAAIPGVLGARMVGAGFGGCVLVALEAAHADLVQQQIADKTVDGSGAAPWMHRVRPAEPAGRLT